jgi:tetratricopeptide (TPR) repeat protein
LEIARQTGYRYGEGFRLLNLARVEIEFQNYQKALELMLQSTKIGDEISRPQLQSNSYLGISLAHLLLNDLPSARRYIGQTLQYDDPTNNHNASALHGIIALRQGDEVAARGAFVRAIGQAEEILSKTAEYYDALDAKGLALCGLALCADDGPQTADDGQSSIVNGQSSMVYRQQAIETFRKARKIAPHAGVVKSALRLFDELAKCDPEGVLKDARAAAEGKE